jgi:hypothetical protein
MESPPLISIPEIIIPMIPFYGFLGKAKNF